MRETAALFVYLLVSCFVVLNFMSVAKVNGMAMRWIAGRVVAVGKLWKPFAVRSCLTCDFLCAIPIFVLTIWHNPKLYAEILAASGETIRRKILEYYAK
jgi:hypothetical protein